MLLLLLACTPEPVDPPAPVGETFDCAAMPESASPERILDGPRGYKGLAFDQSGNIVGWDENALIKSTYDGDWSVFAPGVTDPEQMEMLPDGDLVVTSSWGAGDMVRVTPQGGISLIASGLLAYSVLQGPDGYLWGAGWNGVYRVDPDSGATQTLTETSFDDPVSYRVLAFDGDRLLMGSVDDRGRIFEWALGDDGLPQGEPQVFVEGVGNGWHDGMVMDQCGYLYVVEFESAAMYRVSPDGEVEEWFDFGSERNFGHGIVWGTGQDGWRADAVYLPMPNARAQVMEIVLGVPGPNWQGELE